MRKVGVILVLVMAVGIAHGQVLYRVTGKGIKESYILCVDEMLPASLLVGVKDVFKCYNRCELLVCEMKMEDEEARREVVSEVRLSSLIQSVDTAFVDSVLRHDLGLELRRVELLKPGAVRMMWRGAIRRGLFENGDDDVGMVSFFQQVAVLEGKRVMEVERYDGTNGPVGGNVERQAERMVSEMRGGSELVRREHWQADSLFKAGDAAGLSALQSERMTEAERFEKIGLRTERWAERVIEMMRKRHCLVVLSAMYVTNCEGGVIENIKKKGLTIKGIK